MDDRFLEPDHRPRLYAYTEIWPAQRTMIQVMLSHLHSMGIEGGTGKETVEYQGETVEMAYVEYMPPDDWTVIDVELLASQISKKLGDILEPGQA